MNLSRSAASEPSVILFDLDGVVIDSIPVMEQAFSHAYHLVVGNGEPPFAEYLMHCGKSFPRIMDAMGLPHSLWEPFKDKSRELISLVRVCDGVPLLLGSLREAGKRIALLTGKDRARTLEILRYKEIEAYFDLVLTPDDLHRAKPDPEGVFRVAAKFDVPTNEIWFIGDSSADLECARAAGCYAVYADWCNLSRRSSALCDLADLVVDSPETVHRALHSLGMEVPRFAP
jgi:AHBA synthesis associated protein